ncbi:MAG TPA: YciI family protein [Longimicrobium sp.]|nr:YciI family protein [Longimicrobium sp.]
MQFIALIYNDPTLLDALPEGKADSMLRTCFAHADEMQRQGRLTESRMLADAGTAKSLRIRNGKMTAFDGPYAEAKEVLGGFNIIEAENMDEALEIAAKFPWASTGCVEVRAIQDMNTVRLSVGAPPLPQPEEAAAAA